MSGGVLIHKMWVLAFCHSEMRLHVRRLTVEVVVARRAAGWARGGAWQILAAAADITLARRKPILEAIRALFAQLNFCTSHLIDKYTCTLL